jgi:hypothetical protein
MIEGNLLDGLERVEQPPAKLEYERTAIVHRMTAQTPAHSRSTNAPLIPMTL